MNLADTPSFIDSRAINFQNLNRLDPSQKIILLLSYTIILHHQFKQQLNIRAIDTNLSLQITRIELHIK